MSIMATSGRDPATMTLEEIERELIDSTNSVEHIMLQLSRTVVLGTDRKPLSRDEYLHWRDRARNALYEKQKRRRELWYWKRQHELKRTQALAGGVYGEDLGTTEGLLVSAWMLLKSLCAGQSLNDEQWAVLDCLEAAVMNAPLKGSQP